MGQGDAVVAAIVGCPSVYSIIGVATCLEQVRIMVDDFVYGYIVSSISSCLSLIERKGCTLDLRSCRKLGQIELDQDRIRRHVFRPGIGVQLRTGIIHICIEIDECIRNSSWKI